MSNTQRASSPMDVIMDDQEEEERVEHGPRPQKSPVLIIPDTATTGTFPITPSTFGPTQLLNGPGAPIEPAQQGLNMPPQAGPSKPSKVHHVHYPVGGVPEDDGGLGIFADPETEDEISIWVDPAIRDRISLIKKIEHEYGRVSTEHREATTQLLILSPCSTYIFDEYCHPDWLRPKLRRLVKKRQKRLKIDEEPWQSKVILKEWWIDRCVEAKRFLGEADDWGGCRAGGPPVGVRTSTEEQPETPTEERESFGPAHEEVETHAPPPGEEPFQPEIERPNGQEIGTSPRSDAMEYLDFGDEEDESRPAPELPTEMDVATNGLHPMITEDRQPLEVTGSDNITDDNLRTIPITELAQQDDESDDLLGDDEPIDSEHVHDDGAEEDAPWAMMEDGDEDGVEASLRGIADEDAIVEEEESDPSKMFSGFKFWVDPEFPDRGDLLRRLRKTKAVLSTDFTESTHVLIYNYKAAQWQGIVASLTKRGIWFMDVTWAVKSLDGGRQLPENLYTVPGGDPVRPEDDKKPNVPRPGIGGTKEPKMSPEEIAEIFEREAAMLHHGASLRALCAFLTSKYGTYREGYWQTLYTQWTNKEERFAHLGSPTKRRKVSRPKASPGPKYSTAELKKIFMDEQPTMDRDNLKSYTAIGKYLADRYPGYQTSTWSIMYGEWKRCVGQFKGSGRSATPASEPQAARNATPASSASSTSAPVRAKMELLTNSEVALIFKEREDRFLSAGLKALKVGQTLGEEVGVYAPGTWSNYWLDWLRGVGRFGGLDPSLQSLQVIARTAPAASPSQETRPSPAIVSPLKPKVATGKPAAYTVSEEKEMAEYIANHPGPYKKSAISWMDFAATHPNRTAYAYAQHYAAYQSRIDDLAKPAHPGPSASSSRSAGTVTVTRTSPNVESTPIRGSQAMPVEVGLDDEDEEEAFGDVEDDPNDKDYVDSTTLDDD